MNDSELLALAAQRVRQLGDAATSGVCATWQAAAVRHVARNVDLDCSTHDDADSPEHLREEDCESWGYRDAPWMSLVDSNTAPLLADLLDLAREDVDGSSVVNRALRDLARQLVANSAASYPATTP